MQLSRIIVPGAVRVMGAAASKKRLFQDLADIAAQTYGISAAQAFDAMQERESLGATGVGHGVALPHARIEGLERVVGAIPSRSRGLLRQRVRLREDRRRGDLRPGS